MPLDSLLKLVETLKQRIAEHRNALEQSEALTRYALIDPFLRELGWSTDDPSIVLPEYRIGKLEHGRANSRADYALLSSGNPSVMVEAKKLGEPLKEGLDQGVIYSFTSGSTHFVLTDGQTWEVYHLRGEVPSQPEVMFDLVRDPPDVICRKAFALWRPSAKEGRLLPGESPIVHTPIQSTTVTSGNESQGIAPTQTVPQPTSDNYDWTPITNLGTVTGRTHPSEILLPGGSTVEINSWNYVLVEAFRWLLHSGKLTSRDIPIRLTRGRRYQIAKTPVHSDGKPMRSPEDVPPYFVETHLAAQEAVRLTTRVLEHADQDPAEFKVRFS